MFECSNINEIARAIAVFVSKLESSNNFGKVENFLREREKRFYYLRLTLNIKNGK